MNVTIVCEGFSRSTILFQPWRRVFEISRRMAARGIFVTIISDKKSTDPTTEELDGISIKRMNHLTLAPLLRKKELIEVLLQSNPDIVIWCGTPISTLFLTRLRSVRKPLLLDIDSDIYSLKFFRRIAFRDIFHPHHNLLLLEVMVAICPRFVIRNVANSSLIGRIIVPNQAIKRSFCNIGVSPRKIEVIPSTIDIDNKSNLGQARKNRDVNSKLDLKYEKFVAAYFGAPCTLRGVDTAILGIKKILRKHKDIRLIILSRRGTAVSVAEEHLRSEEEYLIKLIKKSGIEDSVEIISTILDKSRLNRYLTESDVILLPFKLVLSEPPLSVLEAMSLGKVVVTTNLETLREIVGNDRGILIAPNSAEALAQAVLFIKDHREQSIYIGKNAQRYVANLPDWDQIALQFVELLNETLNKSG